MTGLFVPGAANTVELYHAAHHVTMACPSKYLLPAFMMYT